MIKGDEFSHKELPAGTSIADLNRPLPQAPVIVSLPVFAQPSEGKGEKSPSTVQASSSTARTINKGLNIGPDAHEVALIDCS